MNEYEKRVRTFEYPFDSFAEVARCLGVFDEPEVLAKYSDCLVENHTRDDKYQESILSVLHAFDLAYAEGKTDEELSHIPPSDVLQGMALCLADIHYKTKHYLHCFNELLFAAELPGNEGYLDAAIEHMTKRMGNEDYSHTAASARILSEIPKAALRKLQKEPL